VKWLWIPAVVAVAVLLVSIPMARTSTMTFCTSCHEMQIYKTELEKSSHALDKDKKPIECRQCHIPNDVGLRFLTVKTVLGVKDLLVHNFGDPDHLDRRKMQPVARRFVVDENCRDCHQDLTKTVKNEKISEFGRLSHEAYLGKNGTTKNGCAGCHFNMAHLPEFDRRFPFNQKFAEKLPLTKEPSQ
jgi:nitrate/TMAO reductase-like tetraheme cytochrome c subunit